MHPTTTAAPTCSPSAVDQLFRSLLQGTSSFVNPNRLTTSATTTLPPPQQPLTSPPLKNTIRFIENDQNNRREKYDGCRWRLVCTWQQNECTNLSHARQLCTKHNALQRNKELPKRKRKPLLTNASLPILNPNNRKNIYDRNEKFADDDNDIEILEEYCVQPTTRQSMSSNVKLEMADFNVFSVENLDDADLLPSVKSEPAASSTYRPSSSTDIEYVSSKTRANGLNISELMAKNIPPLTDFEEEYIASRLMEKFSTTSLMLDAQLFVHNEAINVVKRNYRLKMDTIAPEYFFDFLLRHPRIALHYNHWFLRCKQAPPSTGCPIDTKVWTLSMIVRGAMASDRMDDEYTG
ncbi:hypothetical protein I4U23_008881 [Adineta vaga]|nr:hypothetical protein I4U23_008881 [Adineta vaga]